MNRRTSLVSLATLALVTAMTTAAEPQLSHVVFFKLKESTPANREQLVRGCQQYLRGHEGTVYFSSGVIAEELSRDVNDKDFDVSLIVVFRNKAAHDVYQTHPRHLKFIEECSELWSQVRVFDSYLPGATGRDMSQRIPIVRPPQGFAGLIRGSVVAKRDRGIVLKVDQVVKQWKNSQAEGAENMASQNVFVVAGKNDHARQLLRVLETGETVTLDVAHREGAELVILELTEDQRARIK